MNLSLQKKIIGGFVFATLVSIIVGVVGWSSNNLVRSKMDEMGAVNLPPLPI